MADTLTPAAFTAATDELLALVDERLPERFWPSEPTWRVAATALLVRTASLLRSIALLMEAGRPSDALLLGRALYEHVVTFCWLLIDPQARLLQWAREASRYRTVLHDETERYGIEILTAQEAAAGPYKRSEFPSLEQRATEVDVYWPTRTKAFRGADTAGEAHLLTMRGLYTGFYRIASRGDHAQADSLDGFLDVSRRPLRVSYENSEEFGIVGLTLPLVSLALIVAHERLGWPDEDRVRAITDFFTEANKF